MVWSRVHILYSSLLNLYSPLIAEMLVSALKSFLICNRKALHCNRDSWYTFVYTLYHEEWLGDQAVSVYILCRSGSYLPYLTCDCANFHVCLSACMQLQYHWKWVHTVVLLSAGRNQASLITACANFLMCGYTHTYQKQLLHSGSSACCDLNELTFNHTRVKNYPSVVVCSDNRRGIG